MEIAQTLDTHPRLYIFLPLMYLIWEDQQVSPAEQDLVIQYLSTQDYLADEEKAILLKWVRPGPGFDLIPLPYILEQVRLSLEKVTTPIDINLIEIGLKVYTAHTRKSSLSFLNTATKYQNILGVLNHEAIYHFYPEWRDTQSQHAITTYTFDIRLLTGILHGMQAGLIKEIKDLIKKGLFEYTQDGDLLEYRQRVYSWCQILADRGYGSISYPSIYGGCDDMRAYYAVMETISYADLSMAIKYGVQFGLFGMSVMALGTEKHHRQYLQDIGTLKLPGCFAMTETGHGSNVKGLETEAIYDHSTRSFIIHTPHPDAQKEYIGNAALHGQLATVFAKMIIAEKDCGVSAFLVPIRNTSGEVLPGVTIEDCGRKMGLNGVDNGTIRFDHVTIPYDALLDRFAAITPEGEFKSSILSDNRRFFTMLGTLVGGRIGVPRSGLTACKIALAIAIKYGDRRKQFGPDQGEEIPILNYRMHQRRLIPYLAKAYACHFALQYITDRFVLRTEDDMQEIEAIAAGIKAYTTWNTTATLQECREACGGKGYLTENRIDDLKNDTDIYTTFEGDNTVLMQLVAKSRLTEFKQSFHNINFMGVINYVAAQAVTTITQKNPLAVRNTDEAHLLDFEFHLNTFKYREQDLLSSAAKRLKRLIDEGMDSFDAFNVCQHHLIQVAEAYIDRIILQQFQLAVQIVQDRDCKNVLTKLCELFALFTIESNNGWYLESNYMEGVKTKAIRKMVNQLCWEIRQDAVPLVESFDIPENCMGIITKKLHINPA